MIVYESIDAFHYAKDKTRKRPVAPEPLEGFRVHGWSFTGQILEDAAAGSLPLPMTVKITSDPEAKQSARKGWRPLLDRDGKCGVSDEIRALFAAFYAGKDTPAPVAEFLAATAPAAPVASPVQAPVAQPARR